MTSSPPNDAALYQEWISSHRFQRGDGADFDAHMASWTSFPEFHIALVQDSAPVARLVRSLQSLAGQYYARVSVTVVAAMPAPPELDSSRLTWIHTDDPWEAANRALLDRPSTDWVGLLRAGDAIAPHAFLALAAHLVANAAITAVYTDEDLLDDDGQRHSPRFKPDFDLELLRATGYIGGLLLATRDAWDRAGGWRHLPGYSDELDLALRLVETLPPAAIGHLPDVLHHRSADHPALALDNNAERLQCLNDHLHRGHVAATAIPGLADGCASIAYSLTATPRVSIIVPTKDQFPLLQRCIDSLFSKTDYPDFELIIVDNGSQDPSARAYLDGLTQLGEARIKVIPYEQPFNFSAMNNLAAREASGELLLLLNNDTAALHPDWLTEMVALALQPDVGAVGARLLYPDGRIQHAGVVLGMAGPAEHPLLGWPAEQAAPLNRTQAVQQYSAVTAACMLTHRDLYLAVGGMDEERFKVAYNDVDFCLKITALGKRILWTPFATLLHEGSASQRKENQAAEASPEKLARFAGEQAGIYEKWMPRLIRDPAYNPNLSLANRDVSPEPEGVLSWNPTPWNPRPRILVHPVDQSGCGQYRLLEPVAALHDSGRCRGYASQRFFNPVEIAKADLASVVVQLPITERHLRALEIYRAHAGAACIVEVDDLITDIPRASPHYRTTGQGARRYFRPSVALADRLVVTTAALAEACAGLGPEVRVMPNYLSGKRWADLAPRRHDGPRPRVGWAGSDSHAGDLAFMVEVVKSLAKEVDWVFLGLCPKELHPYVKEAHSFTDFARYPVALADLALDVAIAPLERNAFNECKSPLKLLEYGVLGYPVVCTDIGTYRDGFPVKRVDNDAKSWIDAIRERVKDIDAARREGEALRAHVLQHYLLEDHLDEWLAAWSA